MYKLLALDLDGTLLNQENQISAQNINAVKRVIHQHGTVVLCSARPVRAIAAVIRNTELEYLIRYLFRLMVHGYMMLLRRKIFVLCHCVAWM